MNPCVRTAISGRPERTKTSYAERRGVVWGRASDKRRLVGCSEAPKSAKIFFRASFPHWKRLAIKRASRGRTRAGVRIRFLFRRAAVSESSSDARVFGKRVLRWLPRAYRRPWPPPPPRTTRGSCPRRARTPPRLWKKKRTGNVRGVLRQRGGNVRDSRMGFGVRFFACRARIEAICGRLARAHLPRRLCRLCRTRLRPGTGPTR